MAVTIVDIAKRLNLAHSTVSKVLNSRQDRFISKVTREKVLDAARQMGYVPNSVARALVTGKTHRIVFWHVYARSKKFQELGVLFQEILQQDRYEVIVGQYGPLLLDKENPVGISRSDVDGIIAWTYGADYLKRLNDVHPLKVPVVELGRNTLCGFDYVGVELYPASRQAAEFLVKKECKRIAYIGAESGSTEDSRYQGYAHVMEQAGRPAEHILFPAGPKYWHFQGYRESIKRYVQEKGHPDGIFCCNDEVAIGVYRGLKDLGIRVPEDVVLVGCDGIEELEYLGVPISTIQHPFKDVCLTAWDFLRKRIDQPSLPQQSMIFNATFVERNQ